MKFQFKLTKKCGTHIHRYVEGKDGKSRCMYKMCGVLEYRKKKGDKFRQHKWMEKSHYAF